MLVAWPRTHFSRFISFPLFQMLLNSYRSLHIAAKHRDSNKAKRRHNSQPAKKYDQADNQRRQTSPSCENISLYSSSSMSFKRGFLNRPDAFGKDHSKGKGNDAAATTEVKEPEGTPKDISRRIYEMSRNFSTILAKGPDAPLQSFRGPMDDPVK
jgi:hypothetical protein